MHTATRFGGQTNRAPRTMTKREMPSELACTAPPVQELTAGKKRNQPVSIKYSLMYPERKLQYRDVQANFLEQRATEGQNLQRLWVKKKAKNQNTKSGVRWRA